MIWKNHEEKIIQNGNITTSYWTYKHKNTGTSVLIHLQNFEKQSVKPSFRLFVQI